MEKMGSGLGVAWRLASEMKLWLMISLLRREERIEMNEEGWRGP